MYQTSKIRRVLTILLSALFIIALVGCTPSNDEPQASEESATTAETTQETSTEDTEEPAATKYMFGDEMQEISILTVDMGYEVSFADSEFVKYMEEVTGVHVNWDFGGTENSDDFKTVFQTRVVAGADVPDFFYIAGDGMDLAEDGILANLTEYNIDEVMPNYMAILNEYDFVSQVTAPDGNMYIFPNYMNVNGNQNLYCLDIRPDWLATLGMDEPTDWDEFKTYLEAVRDNDMNGNGDATDEVPLTAIWLGADVVTTFQSAYELHLRVSEGYYPDASGVVQNEWITEDFKNLLKLANEYYEEGLLTQSFASNDGSERTAQILNNQVGAFCTVTANAHNSVNNKLSESVGDENAILLPIMPLKSYTNGNALSYASDITPGATHIKKTYGISSDSKNIELVMKWLDYVAYSDDGIFINSYGLNEGETYEWVEGETEPILTDLVMKSDNGKNYEMRTRGYYHVSIPYVWNFELKWMSEWSDDLNQRAWDIREMSLDTPCFPTVLATPEESEVIADAKGDLETYKDEMVLKFILGESDIDAEWDSFVATLKDLGIDEVTAVKQAQYDRAMSN